MPNRSCVGQDTNIRNTAARLIHGFQRFDKVKYNGVECFIWGRRTAGYFDLRLIDGTKVNPSVSYKNITLIERAKTLLKEAALPLHPNLTVQDGVPCGS